MRVKFIEFFEIMLRKGLILGLVAISISLTSVTVFTDVFAQNDEISTIDLSAFTIKRYELNSYTNESWTRESSEFDSSYSKWDFRGNPLEVVEIANIDGNDFRLTIYYKEFWFNTSTMKSNEAEKYFEQASYKTFPEQIGCTYISHTKGATGKAGFNDHANVRCIVKNYVVYFDLWANLKNKEFDKNTEDVLIQISNGMLKTKGDAIMKVLEPYYLDYAINNTMKKHQQTLDSGEFLTKDSSKIKNFDSITIYEKPRVDLIVLKFDYQVDEKHLGYSKIPFSVIHAEKDFKSNYDDWTEYTRLFTDDFTSFGTVFKGSTDWDVNCPSYFEKTLNPNIPYYMTACFEISKDVEYFSFEDNMFSKSVISFPSKSTIKNNSGSTNQDSTDIISSSSKGTLLFPDEKMIKKIENNDFKLYDYLERQDDNLKSFSGNFFYDNDMYSLVFFEYNDATFPKNLINSYDIYIDILKNDSDIRFKKVEMNNASLGIDNEICSLVTYARDDIENIYDMICQIDQYYLQIVEYRQNCCTTNVIPLMTSILENYLDSNPSNEQISSNELKKVPDWVKNNAKWWSEGLVDDSTFSQGIGFLIKNKVISVSSLPPQASAVAEEKIPGWIKNNAKWWADGMISEDDFLKGITYMVEKGIIRAQ